MFCNLKRLFVSVYICLVCLLAIATFLEQAYGTDFIEKHIYHSFWFCCVWGILAVAVMMASAGKRLRKFLPALLLHGSFLVILAGAMITFAGGRKGYVHLIAGNKVSSFVEQESGREIDLPFTLLLDSFRVEYYPGTEAPADYISHIRVLRPGQGADSSSCSRTVSMNRILSEQGFRFYQSSFDEDSGQLQASNRMTEMHVCLADAIRKDNRPEISNRLFRSNAVEKEILRVQKLLKNAKLAWMFTNCFPNTLDTTVHFRKGSDGKPDTFVYTGDIHAMWLRDSGAQVWPYVQLANSDPELKEMLAGVILRQFKCINIDPYANAFNDGAIPDGHWMSDLTDMKPELHERKWEIDSLCYPLRLAYHYWKTTGDASIFNEEWIQAITNVLKTFKEQQRKDGVGPYKFQRKTERALDTVSNDGLGAPVKPVGLIVSSFRPSDDATTLQFLVPSNFFAVSSLRKAAEILEKVNKKTALSKECKDLAQEVETALKKYAVYNHPKYGKIYAFEVDGFGNHHLMDDANVPSLLAMPYLGDVNVNDPIYQNTRRFVWSEDNPYFFKGKAGEGIGGPHIGYDMVWPMSIMMKAFTSQNDAEIKTCIKMLMDTDADTGFMHESFHKDNPKKFTRAWFAWQNTLFGELILKLVNEGKVDLLNSIQ